jgi:hypothetical protein
VPVVSCIPIIPSRNIEKTTASGSMDLGSKSISLGEVKRGQNDFLYASQRRYRFQAQSAGATAIKPANYKGVRLYWAPFTKRASA